MDEIELEYHLYLAGDPLQSLKDDASKLSVSKKRVIAPYIRKAESFIKTSEPFRKLLRMEDQDNRLHDIIGLAWANYFENKINKGKMLVIPRDPSVEFMMYFSGMLKTDRMATDKYMQKAQRLILSYEKSIDAFIKAFHSIRLANEKYNSLK